MTGGSSPLARGTLCSSGRGWLDRDVLGSWVECRVYGEGREAMTERLTQLHAEEPDHLHWMLMLARLLDRTERHAEAAELYARVLPCMDDDPLRVELSAQIERRLSAS